MEMHRKRGKIPSKKLSKKSKKMHFESIPLPSEGFASRPENFDSSLLDPEAASPGCRCGRLYCPAPRRAERSCQASAQAENEPEFQILEDSIHCHQASGRANTEFRDGGRLLADGNMDR